MSKKYYLYVHNTMTGKTEKVEVTKDVYEIYTRTSWAIKNNDKTFPVVICGRRKVIPRDGFKEWVTRHTRH